jgi:diguanylate cyclase (GGDEF)-like protein/putative nucleotidyltransferase with HDIG domain
MKKVLFCTDKKIKNLPFSFEYSSQVKKAYDKRFPIVIFEENFIKKRRKKINFSKLSDKVCFIYFSKEKKENLRLVQKLDFFDYFVNDEGRERILFKIKQAKRFLDLKKKIIDLEKENFKKDKKIEKITLIDPLTDCYNWRYFLSRSHQELNRARRHLYNISFIILDIDYFRQINEIYSAKVADFIIKEMVKILKKNLRKEDVLTRWREDEFFIILPYLSKGDAYKVARRLRDKIVSHKFKYKKFSLNVKISVGVVSFPDDKVSNTQDIINALEDCLITAKKRGGDTIVIFSQKEPEIPYWEKKDTDIEELKQRIEQLNSLLTRDLLEMIYGFARAIELKDSYTGRHVEDTAFIAEEIAKELKLPPSEIENIKRAAILHDLGKVGIDERILSKKGPLNENEKEIIKSHPWIAAEILREIHALRGSIPAILYHHERYDGKGYPLGLKGEDIPLGARIVAIADVYQALISDRPYRKAYSKREAIEIIKKDAGKKFDPKIVKIFLKIIKKRNKII